MSLDTLRAISLAAVSLGVIILLAANPLDVIPGSDGGGRPDEATATRELQKFVDAITDDPLFRHFGGTVRAELDGCTLRWSSIYANDCTENINPLTNSFSFDLRGVSGSRTGGPASGLIFSTERSKDLTIVRPLPEVAPEDLPGGVLALADRLGRDFYDYSTFCASPPGGASELTVFVPRTRGESAGELLQAVERLQESCRAGQTIRAEAVVSPAE